MFTPPESADLPRSEMPTSLAERSTCALPDSTDRDVLNWLLVLGFPLETAAAAVRPDIFAR